MFIGDEARELLFNIWSSSDLDNDGKLNKNEFIIACCLINKLLNDGKSIPFKNFSITNTLKTKQANLNPLKSIQSLNNFSSCLNSNSELNTVIISGANDKTIKIWNTKDGKCMQTLVGHTWAVFCIRLVSKNILISGSYDKTIKIWNLTNGRCLNTLEGHSSSILCIISTNEIILSGSSDKLIKCWQIRSGKCIGTLAGHEGYVKCLYLVSNDKLISGSGDKTIKIWNLNKKECLKTLRGHSSYLFLVM